MGVTLERVQFKFASIIGELCSEPDILSQFAVWVDLRLAEYKLKGSISLDCSGDTPDPMWLQGILSALLAKKLASQKQTAKHMGHNNSSASLIPGGNFARMKYPPSKSNRLSARELSPGHLSSSIAIKEEPSDNDIYPVSFHVHEAAWGSRKRLAAETITSEEEGDISEVIYSHSSPKHRRSESSANPSNESLMSIIGIEDPQDSSSSMHYDNIKNTIDIIMDSESASASQDDTSLSHHREIPVVSTEKKQDANQVPGNSGVHVRKSAGKAQTKPPSRLPNLGRFLNSLAPRESSEWMKQEKLNVIHRSDRSRIKNFERFIRAPPYQDSREIVSIPPEELSSYLADFFLTVKTQSGGEFSQGSLVRLRTSLERHLKENSYPCSITFSPQFALTRVAFKKKLQMLKALCPKSAEPVIQETSSPSETKEGSSGFSTQALAADTLTDIIDESSN